MSNFPSGYNEPPSWDDVMAAEMAAENGEIAKLSAELSRLRSENESLRSAHTAILAVLEPVPDVMWEARGHINECDEMGAARAIRAELKKIAIAVEVATALRGRKGNV